MSYTMHRFEDPTGGGDDILVIAPEWVEVPGTLLVHDSTDDNPMEFEGSDEEEGDFKSGNSVRFP